jgi:hypothetical protein
MKQNDERTRVCTYNGKRYEITEDEYQSIMECSFESERAAAVKRILSDKDGVDIKASSGSHFYNPMDDHRYIDHILRRVIHFDLKVNLDQYTMDFRSILKKDQLFQKYMKCVTRKNVTTFIKKSRGNKEIDCWSFYRKLTAMKYWR